MSLDFPLIQRRLSLQALLENWSGSRISPSIAKITNTSHELSESTLIIQLTMMFEEWHFVENFKHTLTTDRELVFLRDERPQRDHSPRAKASRTQGDHKHQHFQKETLKRTLRPNLKCKKDLGQSKTFEEALLNQLTVKKETTMAFQNLDSKKKSKVLATFNQFCERASLKKNHLRRSLNGTSD